MALISLLIFPSLSLSMFPFIFLLPLSLSRLSFIFLLPLLCPGCHSSLCHCLSFSPLDLLVLIVTPHNLVGAVLEVKGGGSTRVLHQCGQLSILQTQTPDVVAAEGGTRKGQEEGGREL